jgi:hypothetical protein
MATMIATEAWDEAALASLIAAATLLGVDLKMGLYTNILTPSKSNVIGDLTEPTYASYARQLVVMGPVFRDINFEISSLAAALVWQQTGTPTPCLIQGWFLTFGAGPALLGICPLDQPFQMNDTLDALTIAAEYIQSSLTQGVGVITT